MFETFRKEIVTYNTVGIFSHERPDGDCIGAQVAMALWLESKGVRALAFNNDPLPANITWLGKIFEIIPPDPELAAQCDAFVLLDGNAPTRFGSYQEIQRTAVRPSYVIDHHPDPEPVFDHIICEPTRSSTCELVTELILGDGPGLIDFNMGRALYTGMLTDTGSFQYDSVTSRTLELAAEVVSQGGFKPSEVAERLFANRTPEQLKLMSRVMGTLRLFENNQFALVYVTAEMLDSTGTRSEDCEGLVNYPLKLSGVKAAMLLKDIDGNGVRISLRSRSEVDVNRWAREMEGGGHKKAAGAKHPGPLEDAIDDMIAIGAKQLRELEKQKIPS